ncbi:MAG: hypothetical protein OSB09_05225 [Planctomycetota bacterium]|nr:hypothetical protein [Planctomycetota bacterium]
MAWCLLLAWALLTGGIGSDVAPARVIERFDQGPVSAAVGVDLGRDPISRLLLIEGIGSVTAHKIARARTGDRGFLCLCQVMRIGGVPDRPLLQAGPWLRPRPCIGGPEMCKHPSLQSPPGRAGNR